MARAFRALAVLLARRGVIWASFLKRHGAPRHRACAIGRLRENLASRLPPLREPSALARDALPLLQEAHFPPAPKTTGTLNLLCLRPSGDCEKALATPLGAGAKTRLLRHTYCAATANNKLQRLGKRANYKRPALLLHFAAQELREHDNNRPARALLGRLCALGCA